MILTYLLMFITFIHSVGHTIRSQGLFNLVFPTRTRSFHPPMATNHSSRRCVLIDANDMAEPAEPLVINTLSNVHVIEELIQLPVGSDTVVIANSYWTKNLAQHFSLEQSQGHKEARVGVLISSHVRGLLLNCLLKPK